MGIYTFLSYIKKYLKENTNIKEEYMRSIGYPELEEHRLILNTH